MPPDRKLTHEVFESLNLFKPMRHTPVNLTISCIRSRLVGATRQEKGLYVVVERHFHQWRHDCVAQLATWTLFLSSDIDTERSEAPFGALDVGFYVPNHLAAALLGEIAVQCCSTVLMRVLYLKSLLSCYRGEADVSRMYPRVWIRVTVSRTCAWILCCRSIKGYTDK